ncbi:MAG: GDSL-type esterase/lipase family protein, partial [Acidimicrobiia bacterium]
SDLSTTVVRTDQAPWDDPILEPSGGTPSSALDRIAPDTPTVTLTVGGNDLGFSDIVSDCLLGFESCTGHDAQVQLDLATLEGTLQALFSDLGARLGPTARVLVVGYPRIFPAVPVADCDFIPLLPVGTFTLTEQEWANTKTRDLNAVLQSQAERSNQPGGPEFTYVDTWGSFTRHNLCWPDPGTGKLSTSSTNSARTMEASVLRTSRSSSGIRGISRSSGIGTATESTKSASTANQVGCSIGATRARLPLGGGFNLSRGLPSSGSVSD